MIDRSSLIVLVLVLVCSCGRATPAGFWPAYRPELIERKYSDQGPWGGTRWIHWTSPDPGTFRATDVLQYAKAMGWSCGASVLYSAEQLRQWRFSGQAVFPLHFSAGDRPPDNGGVLKFPRHIAADSLVHECKTGWIRADPGTGVTSDAFGYIQIERAGTRMAVYHLWGEI